MNVEPCIKNDDGQAYFDKTYITAGEIRRRLKVSSPTILRGRRKGRLPGAIEIRGLVYIWERVAIEPYLKKWETEILELKYNMHLI